MIQTAFEFLQQHNEGVLATVSEGRPQTRVFQIMRQEEHTLFFATAPQKAVYTQLQTNSAVEFIVLADKVMVRCSGDVQFDVAESICRWIYDHNPVLPRLYSAWDKLVYFRLPVDILEYFDLRPTPPISLHTDLHTLQTSEGFRGERFMT